MPKPMYVWSGSAWVSVASEVESLATYATQSYADNIPGSKLIVPSSVAVGSGSGSVATQGTVSFSGASSVSVNGCFSSTYENYRIMIYGTATSTTTNITLKLRASGTDTSANYAYAETGYRATAATIFGNSTSTTNWYLGETSSTGTSVVSLDLFRPNLATQTSTNFQSVNRDGTSVYIFAGGGVQTDTTQFDGFTILTGTANTISGSVSVYGYKAG